MKKALLTTVLTVALALITYLLLPPQTPISPLGSNTPSPPLNQESKFIVLGFAPYWNMKKLSTESLESITHLAYFALHLFPIHDTRRGRDLAVVDGREKRSR